MAQSGGMRSHPEGPPAGRRSMPEWARNTLYWAVGMPLVMGALVAVAFALHGLALLFPGW